MLIKPSVESVDTKAETNNQEDVNMEDSFHKKISNHNMEDSLKEPLKLLDS